MTQELITLFLANPLAQIFGIIAAIMMTYSGTIQDDKKMLYIFNISLPIWSIHFFLLGFMSAASLYLFMFVRNYFLFKFEKNKTIYTLSAIIPFIILYFTYENHTDVLAALAPIIFIGSVYFFKGFKMRLGFVIISFIWLYYSWYAQSIGGIATEIAYLAGITIGTYKVLKAKRLHTLK